MLAEHQQAPEQPPADVPRVQRRAPVAEPVPGQPQLPPRAALLTQPGTTTQPTPAEVLAEIPDPASAIPVFERRLAKLREEQANQLDQRVVRNFERVVAQTRDYLSMIAMPTQVPLTLAECTQRALSHNYTIRIEAHNPAISQTQIVEAEAAFDVEFFLDTSWAWLDRAVEPDTVPGTSNTRSMQGGFRKLMPTGMQASVSLASQRVWSGLPQGDPKTWNPQWPTSWVANIRQPLLRGFGLDVNRAQINIAKVQHKISQEAFIEQVRDTLLNVESAYWQLAQARRQVTIFAESVAQNYVTKENMRERLGHDATQVEVSNSQARWQQSYVNYLETIKLVRDAEDRLKNLINDPDLKLSERLEIIPTELPFVGPIVLDHFAEVRTALDRRSEIHQAQQRINVARINTTVAKNQILPQLDVSFQYEVQGLGPRPDDSFHDLTSNRFVSYTLGVSFAYSFGERRARAAHRRAELQESQAVVALNQAADLVVEEVNQGIRQLMVRYDQLPPALDSVRSAERNLRSLQARTQKIDPNYLQTELAAVEQLASTRSTLLTVMTEYNVGIVQLEKAKGTLLDYNNVVVSNGPAGL